MIYKLDKVHLGARNEIRQIIQGYLFTSATNAPHFVREKYAKLLVDIAKLDWPHEYPDFMNFMEEVRILHLIPFLGTIPIQYVPFTAFE